MNREVLRPGYEKEKQVYHINLLKLWREREGLLVTPLSEEEEFSHDRK